MSSNYCQSCLQTAFKQSQFCYQKCQMMTQIALQFDLHLWHLCPFCPANTVFSFNFGYWSPRIHTWLLHLTSSLFKSNLECSFLLPFSSLLISKQGLAFVYRCCQSEIVFWGKDERTKVNLLLRRSFYRLWKGSQTKCHFAILKF